MGIVDRVSTAEPVLATVVGNPPLDAVPAPPGYGMQQRQQPMVSQPMGQVMARDQQMVAIEDEDKSVTFKEGRGYTPSGGSVLQQSSRFVMAVILLVTVVIMVALLRYMFSLKSMMDEELKSMEEFEKSLGNSSAAFQNEKAAFVKEYEQALNDGKLDTRLACDVPYFANSTREGATNLVETFSLLDRLVSIFAYVGTVFVIFYLITKVAVTRHFSSRINREENAITKMRTVDEFVKNVHINPINNIHIGGQLETEQQRRTRVFLRSETLLYMFVNAIVDLPVLTFATTYQIMRKSTRGLSCAECFSRFELCEVGDFASLDTSVKLAVAFAVMSLLWNATILGERWYEWFKYRREIQGVYFNPNYFLCTILICCVCYLFIIATPMIILYHNEIGPTYFGLSTEAERSMEIIGYIGMAVWGCAFILINVIAGIDPWEVLAAPCLAFEVCEAACEQGSCCCCC